MSFVAFTKLLLSRKRSNCENVLKVFGQYPTETVTSLNIIWVCFCYTIMTHLKNGFKIKFDSGRNVVKVSLLKDKQKKKRICQIFKM